MRPVRLSAKLRPVGEDAFEEEDFGPVAFVPLVGAEGWPEKGEPRPPKIDAQETGFAAGLLIPEQRARSVQTGLS
jgi:hypothetical protein